MVGDIFQPTHLLFVLVVALLVLGPKRLPEVGRTLGSGIRDFRQALSGEAPDPPKRQDSEQVGTTSTELRHQPDVAPEDTSWPEEAIGPTSFDEPVEAASAEPATAVATEAEPATVVFGDAEPTESAVDDGAAHEMSGPMFADEVQDEPVVEHSETPAGDLSFYEHALARRTPENGSDSPESHTEQSS